MGKVENYITKQDIEVAKNKKVTAVKSNGDYFSVTFEDTDGSQTSIDTKNIFFSNPLLEFIDIFEADVPEAVINSAKSLNYRNHISVHVTIDKKLFDDNWIYIHSPNLNMARIADFTNFSDDMSEKGTYPLTLNISVLKMIKFGTRKIQISLNLL